MRFNRRVYGYGIWRKDSSSEKESAELFRLEKDDPYDSDLEDADENAEPPHQPSPRHACKRSRAHNKEDNEELDNVVDPAELVDPVDQDEALNQCVAYTPAVEEDRAVFEAWFAVERGDNDDFDDNNDGPQQAHRMHTRVDANDTLPPCTHSVCADARTHANEDDSPSSRTHRANTRADADEALPLRARRIHADARAHIHEDNTSPPRAHARADAAKGDHAAHPPCNTVNTTPRRKRRACSAS